MVRRLCGLGLLGLASIPGSAAEPGPADVTCVEKASDQATYTGASGAVYQILCGIDYAGPDIAATQSSTFTGCIDACDSTAGCVDVSYVGEQCYMKSKIGTADERDWVWTAKQVTPAPSGGETDNKLTCVDKKSDKTTYTTSTGAVFDILCGIDYAGGDMGATNAATFEECIDACAATAGCIDVSYNGNACYMKNKLEPAQDREWVWTAKLVGAGGGGGPVETDDRLTCEGNASDGKIYKATKDNFEITCGRDYAGGDLLNLNTASFEECIEACDSHAECVNVAYNYGGCYLKNEQNPAVDSAVVWSAVRKPTTPTDPTKAPLSCKGNASNLVEYTSVNNGVYQIMCGVDYYGNDLPSVSAATFEECIAACDANAECVDVSYVAPVCYLKNAVGESSQTEHVWTAKQIKPPGSGAIQCPGSDKQVYTDEAGNQWMVRCNYDFMYSELAQTKVDTMEECSAWCANLPNCVSVSYLEHGDIQGINCWSRSRDNLERDGQWHSMTLINRFEVISAVFGTADITDYAVANFQMTNRLVIDTNAVANSIRGKQDPLPGTPKSLFVLYRRGIETRSWVGRQSQGVVTILPGAIESAPHSSMAVPDWPAPSPLPHWIRIVEVCYGLSQIRNQTAWDIMYNNAYNGDPSPMVNEFWVDTWLGTVKTAVVWYKDTRAGEDGPLHVVTGVEHSYFTLMGPAGNFKRRPALPRRNAPGQPSAHHA